MPCLENSEVRASTYVRWEVVQEPSCTRKNECMYIRKVLYVMEERNFD